MRLNRRAMLVSAALILLGAALAGVALSAMGVRFFTISTPSMGETHPVGSLVMTAPVDSYKVGDVIAFPQSSDVFVHRIADQTEAGRFLTQGDLNYTVDAWTLAPEAVIGAVVWSAPGLGFVAQAAPVFILGGVAIWLVSRLFRRSIEHRWTFRILGWFGLTAGVAMWLRPWVDLSILGHQFETERTAIFRVVNTGLFPIRVEGEQIRPGQDAVVRATSDDSSWLLVPQAVFTPTVVAVIVILVGLPLLLAWAIRFDHNEPRVHPVGRRFTLGLVGLLAASLAAVTVASPVLAQAAFSASVQNENSAGLAAPISTCRSIQTGRTGVFLAWSLETPVASHPDLTGNSRNGTQWGTPTLSNSFACVRDTPKTSLNFSPTSRSCIVSPNFSAIFTTYSVEAWFRTGTAPGGRIIGFGSTPLGSTTPELESNGRYDRVIYLDSAGRVTFVNATSPRSTLSSPAGTSYADNQWHHVVGVSTGTTTSLYVDGVLRASQAVSGPFGYVGSWKVGCGSLDNFGSSVKFFTGQIQYAAVYQAALTQAQVTEHYQAGR